MGRSRPVIFFFIVFHSVPESRLKKPRIHSIFPAILRCSVFSDWSRWLRCSLRWTSVWVVSLFSHFFHIIPYPFLFWGSFMFIASHIISQFCILTGVSHFGESKKVHHFLVEESATVSLVAKHVSNTSEVWSIVRPRTSWTKSPVRSSCPACWLDHRKPAPNPSFALRTCWNDSMLPLFSLQMALVCIDILYARIYHIC